GNDLLDIFFNFVLPGRCPSVAEGLQKPECVQQLRNALDNYEPNLDKILNTLQQADPQLNIFLMTLYNPFSGASPVLDELGELSLEGRPDTPFPEGLQDIIRRQAQAHGVHLVEVYPLFEGKAHESGAGDTIHPNDTGYRVIADAVIAEMRAAGVIEWAERDGNLRRCGGRRRAGGQHRRAATRRARDLGALARQAPLPARQALRR